MGQGNGKQQKKGMNIGQGELNGPDSPGERSEKRASRVDALSGFLPPPSASRLTARVPLAQ